MIKKIISGGQTGADQAALDAAIELGIPHGGWVPKGRKTEKGPLPDKYHVQEMPTSSYPTRTEQNVIDSDGTLIITHGTLTGGSALTMELAVKHNRPCLHIDLDIARGFVVADMVKSWIQMNGVQVLNVAGSRASKDPDIHDDVVRLLKAVHQLFVIDTKKKDQSKPLYPRTVEEAIDRLVSELPLKDRMKIARMDEVDIHCLHTTLGLYIRNNYGLWLDNGKLIRDCRFIAKDSSLDADDASAVIIHELWQVLRESHELRLLK